MATPDGGERIVAATAVPASSKRRTTAQQWWFGILVRAILAVMSLVALGVANDRYNAFWNDYMADFRWDAGRWLAWLVTTMGAGFLLGLATWLPFTRVRYSWSRLLLAALPLVPIVQFW